MLASAIAAKEGTRGRIQGVNEANFRFMWSANQPYNSRKPPREPPVVGHKLLHAQESRGKGCLRVCGRVYVSATDIRTSLAVQTTLGSFTGVQR